MIRLFGGGVGACLALAAILPAQAQTGNVKLAAAACVDQVMREVPTWGALRRFRDQMRAHGFTANIIERSGDPKNGRQWVVYRIQNPAEKNAIRLACDTGRAGR